MQPSRVPVGTSWTHPVVLSTAVRENSIYELRKASEVAYYAKGAQQGPARVDQLNLAVACECLGVRRQASSVPAVVTRELSIQIICVASNLR